ncbi:MULTISPECIES: hypothetical protein [unclassified Streptomyces]|uniref:hypothetical protein n=1 Tax=unclassified Streptomyces TaxID=2593676 RepID=UPI0036F75774
MSISSGQPSLRQWNQAQKELHEGHVDHLARWDHDTNKPVVTDLESETRRERRA